MDVNTEKFYLYRHIKEDDEEPFYIGIGKIFEPGGEPSKKLKTLFSRAFSKANRSRFWKSVVERHGYYVEIIFSCCSSEEIKKKEIEFISLYGRRDNRTGLLCNMTDGGDGCNNRIVPEEERKRKSEFFKDPKNNPTKKGRDNPNAKIIFIYDLDGKYLRMFESVSEAIDFLGVTIIKRSSCIREDGAQFCKGYLIADEYLGGSIKKYRLENKKSWRAVIQMDMAGNIIKEFDSITKAALFLGLSSLGAHISSVCKGKLQNAYGYKWKYKTYDKQAAKQRTN